MDDLGYHFRKPLWFRPKTADRRCFVLVFDGLWSSPILTQISDTKSKVPVGTFPMTQILTWMMLVTVLNVPDDLNK
jgi:hypothetical protein